MGEGQRLSRRELLKKVTPLLPFVGLAAAALLQRKIKDLPPSTDPSTSPISPPPTDSTRTPTVKLPPTEMPTIPVVKVSPTETLPPPMVIPRPEGLPEDTLSEEELKASHITIHQSKETQLYLRRDVLSSDIFKDAIERKTGDIVISLVDSEVISWNAIDKLTEDARLAYQADTLHPRERSESFWAGQQQDYQQRIFDSKQNLQFWQNYLDRVPLVRADYELQLKNAKANFAKGTPEIWQPQIDYWEGKLRDLPSQSIQYFIEVQENKKLLEENQRLAEILKDRQAAIDYYAEHYGPIGLFINTRRIDTSSPLDTPKGKRIDLAKGKNLLDKVYIYVAVGGRYKPHPFQSYLSPDQFTIIDDPNKENYSVFAAKGPETPGSTIRHEVAHYTHSDGKPHNEYQADHGALDSIIDAWTLYKTTGNNRKYGYVFVNDEGMTITEKVTDEVSNN